MFALPISNGAHFNFNLNPNAESLIAIIALPLVGSMVFILASRAIGRFGGASVVAAVLIGIIVFTKHNPVKPPDAIFTMVFDATNSYCTSRSRVKQPWD
jgi:hypothetical protein